MTDTARIVSERGIFDTPVSANVDDVLSAREYVLKSEVLDMIKQWELDDRKEAGLRGARGPFASAEQILTIFFMLARKEKPLTMTAATSLVYHGMKRKARDELGLSFSKKSVTAQQIYDRLYRSFHRFMKILDPYPMPKRCLMTKAEFSALLEASDRQRERIMLERSRTVFNRMLLATIPRWVRRRTKGNVVVDGTLVAAYGQQGTKKHSKYMGIEPYADYYIRSEDHYYDPSGKVSRQDIKGVGWEAVLAVLGTNDPDRKSTVPQVITGINMATPGASPGRSAIHALKHMFDETHVAEDERFEPGVLVGDRIYGNTPVARDFQIPAREMGFQLLFDMKEQYWGKTYQMGGAVMLEGNAYSPAITSMPKLITATIDRYRKADHPQKIDEATYQQRLQQRAKYLVKFRTAQRSDGSRQGRCPAAGDNATLHCPLRKKSNTTVSKKGKTLLPIPKAKVPSEEHRGGLCNNDGGTMELRGESWDKHALGGNFQYQTEKWHKYYSSLRQSVESANRYAKDGASIALASADRRRIRGFTAAFFFSTLLLMHSDLKTIARWNDKNLDSQGRGDPRDFKGDRLRDRTNGLERPGLLPGETEPPKRIPIPYDKAIVGIE